MGELIPSGKSFTAERNNFDAIRLAMALLVVWSHSFQLHLGTDRGEWVNRLTGGLYSGGAIAVMVFFTISGFLVSQSYDRSKSWLSYLSKRVRRIHPGYMVATTICAFIIIPLYSTHTDLSVVRIVRVTVHNFLLTDLPPSNAFATNPDHRVNGSLWTILFEFECYLGVLLLGAKRRYSLIALLVMALLARVGMDLFLAQPGSGASRLPYLWTAVLPSFLVGMLAYSYRHRLARNRFVFVGLSVAAIVSCQLNAEFANLIVAPSLGYATFYIAFSNRMKLHTIGKNGDFSYGTYLYAFPIQQMLQAEFGGSIGLTAYIAASLALSLVAGVASWHLVEKHFLPHRRLSSSEVPSTTDVTTQAKPAFDISY